jgi:hypothetical protein
MKKGVNLVFTILFLMLIAVPFVSSAQQIIQTQAGDQAQPKGAWASFVAILKSPAFWWGFVIFLLIVGAIIGIGFFIRWLIKFIKQNEHVFYKIRIEKMKLAKAQKTYTSKAWLHYEKNTPIRLVRKNADGKPYITKPIAYHRGDYTSHEGNIIIAFNMKGNEVLWFIPKTELLIIPNRKSVNIQTKNSKGVIETVKLDNLPTAKDLVQFNENEILIHAESICNTGFFYVPVVKTKEGQIIDLSVPVYLSLKDVALGNLLFDQTDEFVQIAKKSVDMNPNLRYDIKRSDTNQSIEVPSGTGG